MKPLLPRPLWLRFPHPAAASQTASFSHRDSPALQDTDPRRYLARFVELDPGWHRRVFGSRATAALAVRAAPPLGIAAISGRLAKRTLDLVVAVLARVGLSPLLLAIAILVRHDGGPALFGHSRIGQGGQRFRCLKFRTMVIGAVLRKTSLDELPQLLNVLRGEMSLVGPRPIVAAEVPRYGDDIAAYYAVPPGVTGLWQVSGRSDTTYAHRVQLDVSYVRNWSFWRDLKILLKTVPAVLARRGAV